MNSYLKISIWITTLIAVFVLACESESSDVTDIRAVEPAAAVETQTKTPPAKTEETAEAEKQVKIEVEEQAKIEAEAKAKAAAEAKAKAEAEQLAQTKAQAKAIADAEQTAKAETVAEQKAKAQIKDKAETEEQAATEIEQTTQTEVKTEEQAVAETEEIIRAELEKEAQVEVEQAEVKQEIEAVAETNIPADKPVKTVKAGVAATVDGVDITESEIEAMIKPQLDKMTAQRRKIPPRLVEQYKKQLMQQALERIIGEKLLDEQVKAKNIVTTEEDVINHLKEVGSQQQPPLSLEDIKAIMESQGQTFEQAKEQIKKGLNYRKLFESVFDNQINITEEDAQQYYSENKQRFKTPEQVRASHILIEPDTAAGADPNEAKAKAKAKAQELLKQIKAGADFAKLAKAHSACGSAAGGGDLGFKPRGSWVREFENAAFALKPGQVSGIVETQFGYHIIKVTGHKDAGVTTFEQAKDDIMNMLKAKKYNELAVNYVNSLKAKANIVYAHGQEPNSSNIDAIGPK